MMLAEAISRNSYARRPFGAVDIVSWPQSLMGTMPPMGARWVVTSKALVDNWRGEFGGVTMVPGDKIGEFWYADGGMRHLRYLETGEWRLVHKRDDWEPWEFFRYVVEFRYRDPRDYIVWDRMRKPRWLLG